MSKDDDLLADAKDAFARVEEVESENRLAALEDIRFAKLGEQWPEAIRQQRIKDGRPCLTSNMLPSFIRQVVNDIRKNRPSIKVHPVGGGADLAVAEIYSGLIRNIERTSKADVAYVTAADSAISGGFGYFTINTDYASDKSFDLDICFEAVPNPFSVYGDPLATGCDSADWNEAFVVEALAKTAFEAKYKGAEPVNFETDGYSKLPSPWFSDQTVMVAGWWRRTKAVKTILMLSDETVLEADVYAKQKDTLDAQSITVLGERKASGHKVTHTVLTGAEVLERRDWPGKYIPIVPVYGDEVNVEGKRHFRSLIRDAKDEQRMRNYFRTASTELTALAPKVPFIGKKGTFKSDAKKWATINSANHAYVEYDGNDAPERQPLDSGRAIGAIQETLNATDGMKSILGMYNASLGAQGNETSGKAIIARKEEGDTSSYHFIDNLARGIEHGGRIAVDLIPHVYTEGRIIRVLGVDGVANAVKLGSPIEVKGPDGEAQIDPATQMPMTKICDLGVGTYDLTVETGPSYGTKREETADQILNMIQAYPPAAPILGDLLAKNLDWPEADEVARRMKALLPPQLQEGQQDPMQHPQVQQLVQQGQQVIQQQGQALQETQQQLQQAEQALIQAKQANVLKARELEIKAYEAETARIVAQKPEPLRAIAAE